MLFRSAQVQRVLDKCTAIATEAFAAIRRDTTTPPDMLRPAAAAVTCAVLGAHVAVGDHAGALRLVAGRNTDNLTHFSPGCYRHAVSATLRAKGPAAWRAFNEIRGPLGWLAGVRSLIRYRTR